MGVPAKEEIKVLSGNQAAAEAVVLCQPDVVCAYPITPQSEVVEELSKFQAEGKLETEFVDVEGEHSALSVLIGASSAGARTFSATSSHGLLFMFEPYCYASTLRLPIIMAHVCRELAAPNTVLSSQQDIMTMRDGGWIQIHCSSVQEILDSTIMAYRLAEDPEVLLPVNICYDGHYLSHLNARVEIPDQAAVSAFLPAKSLRECRLDPDKPMMQAPFLSGKLFTEFRYKHCSAMQTALTKIDKIDAEFGKAFGRSYGGQIEEYRTEDADIVLVAIGSAASTARAVIDSKRKDGLKIGLIRIRCFRPFPVDKIAKALRNKKAVGVIDRNVCYGWNAGVAFLELRTLLSHAGLNIPAVDFICGLSGTDITLNNLKRAVDTVRQASLGKPYQEVTWLDLE
jgi:phenylglyoxylate dehydrogenase alpha subunit